MAKKISCGQYWTEEIDKAIAEYQQTNDEQLFTEKIYPAFRTAVESLFHRRKFSKLVDAESVINETITHLFLQIKNFKSEKGSGFSYFSMVALRYLQLKSIKIGDMEATHIPIVPHEDEDCHLKELVHTPSFTLAEEKEEFLNFFVNYMRNNVSRYFKNGARSTEIAKVIIEMIADRHVLCENLKSGFFSEIRRRFGGHLSTGSISIVTRRLKRIYTDAKRRYYDTGIPFVAEIPIVVEPLYPPRSCKVRSSINVDDDFMQKLCGALKTISKPEQSIYSIFGWKCYFSVRRNWWVCKQYDTDQKILIPIDCLTK